MKKLPLMVQVSAYVVPPFFLLLGFIDALASSASAGDYAKAFGFPVSIILFVLVLIRLKEAEKPKTDTANDSTPKREKGQTLNPS